MSSQTQKFKNWCLITKWYQMNCLRWRSNLRILERMMYLAYLFNLKNKASWSINLMNIWKRKLVSVHWKIWKNSIKNCSKVTSNFMSMRWIWRTRWMIFSHNMTWCSSKMWGLRRRTRSLLESSERLKLSSRR